jgi:hypothetical protein
MYDGKLVSLRALDLSDLDAIEEHWNTWELRRSIGVPLPGSRRGLDVIGLSLQLKLILGRMANST